MTTPVDTNEPLNRVEHLKQIQATALELFTPLNIYNAVFTPLDI